MPAIQPARLKIQIASLVEQFGHPEIFVDQVHDLLSLYANRVNKVGETGHIRNLTPTYNPPSPVLKLLQNELRPEVGKDPEAALALVDALWVENWWECRSLAAYLLGQIELHDPEPVLQRLSAWLDENLEEKLAVKVSQEASTRLREAAPDRLVDWIAQLMASPADRQKKVALRFLTMLVNEPSFKNLPAVFRMSGPYLRKVSTSLRYDVLTLLEALIARSPNEAAYLLRQMFDSADNPDSAWFIRKTLPKFPAELRSGLREVLFSSQPSPRE